LFVVVDFGFHETVGPVGIDVEEMTEQLYATVFVGSAYKDHLGEKGKPLFVHP